MKEISRLLRRRRALGLLRRHARRIAVLLLLVGTVAFLALPHPAVRLPTRPDENALLPGQISTHWSWRENDAIVTARAEVAALSPLARSEWLTHRLTNLGLDVHSYQPTATGNETGDVIYAILRAPKGDGSEALVLSSTWENERTGTENQNGILLALALAGLWSRESYWAKDVIIVVAPTVLGAEEWTHAYHSPPDPALSSSITAAKPMVRAGSIQAAVHLDFPEFYFASVGIRYDGLDGAQPNLDIINTIVRVAHSLNLPTSVNEHAALVLPTWLVTALETIGVPAPSSTAADPNGYTAMLARGLTAVRDQAASRPLGPHGVFRAYAIDAVSVVGEPAGRGLYAGQSLASVGSLIESTFRSLNNLLERLHHSFSFYVLLTPWWFVPISVYVPAVVAANAALLVSAIEQYLVVGEGPLPDASSKATVPGDATRHPRNIAAVALVVGSISAWSVLVVNLPPITHSARHLVSLAGPILVVLAWSQHQRQSTPKTRHSTLLLVQSFAQTITAALTMTLAVTNYAQSLMVTVLTAPAWIVVAVLLTPPTVPATTPKVKSLAVVVLRRLVRVATVGAVAAAPWIAVGAGGGWVGAVEAVEAVAGARMVAGLVAPLAVLWAAMSLEVV
ncbi:Gaa1-like protein [Blastocladiella britannica]|nr:Gaa1-like protein [Blastocladiella britannica]